MSRFAIVKFRRKYHNAMPMIARLRNTTRMPIPAFVPVLRLCDFEDGGGAGELLRGVFALVIVGPVEFVCVSGVDGVDSNDDVGSKGESVRERIIDGDGVVEEDCLGRGGAWLVVDSEFEEDAGLSDTGVEVVLSCKKSVRVAPTARNGPAKSKYCSPSICDPSVISKVHSRSGILYLGVYKVNP